MLVTIAVLRLLRGSLSWELVRAVGVQAVIMAALTISFNVVSFVRDVGYWVETVGGEDLEGKPEYHLPLSVLPGWVLQTRQFYALQSPPLFYLPKLTQAPVLELLGGTILPAVFVAVIAFGLWRERRGVIVVPVIVVFAALAEYASAAHRCSYCVDRNTLPSAPTTIVLLTLGIVALATAGRRWMRWAAILVAVAAVVAVGEQTRTERQLFAAEAYFLGGDERAVVSAVPPHAGPVDLEGFGENPQLEQAVAELPLMYTLLYERNHGEVSLPSEYSNNNSLAYLFGPAPSDPDFTPDYRYVITRLGGVETPRRVLARAGPLALKERVAPLDATITSGVAVPMVREDARGLPYVIETLRLLVLGGSSAPVWVLLRFRTVTAAAAPAQPDVRARATAHELTVCVKATGTAPVRRAKVSLSGTLYTGAQPPERFALEEPPRGITLVSMRAAASCSLSGAQ